MLIFLYCIRKAEGIKLHRSWCSCSYWCFRNWSYWTSCFDNYLSS